MLLWDQTDSNRYIKAAVVTLTLGRYISIEYMLLKFSVGNFSPSICREVAIKGNKLRRSN